MIVETGQQVRDRGVVQGHPKNCSTVSSEVALGGDAVGQPLLRQHVLRHARAAHLLGVDAQDHHALGFSSQGSHRLRSTNSRLMLRSRSISLTWLATKG